MQNPYKAPTNTLLDLMRYQADEQADATVSRIVGGWNEVSPEAGHEDSQRINAAQWRRLNCVNRLFGTWQNNSSLIGWRTQDPDTPPEIAAELEAYVRSARILPDWADREKIELAEKVFFDNGVLSCTLLFCSSLPECYVIPDLASVLYVSGQLQAHTDYRIRTTAAMIFPVMMSGGLTQPEGSGIAQILKVRLIHATIRNLILHGNPEAAVLAFKAGTPPAGIEVLPPQSRRRPMGKMHQSLFDLGWNLHHNALPCNQEELAYTLLTFSYVFLRSLRRLGLGLSQTEEDAYLHIWNVVGHVLGLRCELMVNTMDQAAALFALIQTRGRSRQVQPDARPELARALMKTMKDVLPFRILKPFPTLLTIHLCGDSTAKELGLRSHTAWPSRWLFAACMWIVRGIDSVMRRVFPGFTISRLITRLLSRQFMQKILMDQIRPLKLPDRLMFRIQSMMYCWQKNNRP